VPICCWAAAGRLTSVRTIEKLTRMAHAIICY
jgi:hypothetical protein